MCVASSSVLCLVYQLSPLNRNYEVHEIATDERVEELLSSSSYCLMESRQQRGGDELAMIPWSQTPKSPLRIVEGASLLRLVGDCESLKEFDRTVEIIDSVVVDHVSEDDKSTSSDEVTYERWTEETRMQRTRVYDQEGRLVDEYLQQVQPAELVGDIVRERLIERHEHVKHVSKDLLKRVKVKSICDSHDIEDVIIVEPNTSTRRATPSDMYFIQHQQVIKPPIISGDDDRLIQHKTHSCGDSCSVVKLIPNNPAVQSSLTSTSSSSSSASSSNNFSALSSTFNLYAAATIAASSTPLHQQSHEKQEETAAKISFDIINSVLNQNHTVVASSDLLLQQPVNSSSSPTLSLLLSNFYCFFCLYLFTCLFYFFIFFAYGLFYSGIFADFNSPILFYFAFKSI